MGGLLLTSTSLFFHAHGGGEGSSLFLWCHRFRKKFMGVGRWLSGSSACCVCWLGFVNLSQTRVAWEDGTSVEELLPSVWPVGMSMEHFLNQCLRWESPAHYRQGHLRAGGPGLCKTAS